MAVGQKHMQGTTRAAVEAKLADRELAFNLDATQLEGIMKEDGVSTYLHFPSLETFALVTVGNSGAGKVAISAISGLTSTNVQDALQELKDITDSPGYVAINPDTSVRNIITAMDAAVIPLRVRWITGQTADLTRWENNAGTSLAKVDKNGFFTSSSAQSAAAVNMTLANTSNTANSTAILNITTGGSSASDPYIHFAVTGAGYMDFGISNTDSDAGVLAISGTQIQRWDSSGTVISGSISASNLSGTNTGNQTITLTSDVTGSGTGSFATTIGANVVTYAKFQQVAASSLVGNATGSLTNAAGITLGAALAFSGSALQTVAMTGDISTSANSFATTIGANKVTLAMQAQMSTGLVLGRSTAGTGNVEALSTLPNAVQDNITRLGAIASASTATFSGAVTIAGVFTNNQLTGTGTRVVTSSSAGALSNTTTIAGANTWSGAQTFSAAMTVSSTIKAAGKISSTGGTGVYSYGVGLPGDTNTEFVRILHDGSSAYVECGKTGTGSARSLYFQNNGNEAFRILADGTTAFAYYMNYRADGFSDADYSSWYAGTQYLPQTGTLTANRTVTLPAANSVAKGTIIVIADESGSCSNTTKIIVAAVSGDNINGLASDNITTAYGTMILMCNNSHTWVKLNDYEKGTFTATLTGVSGSVTGTCNYIRQGNHVTIQIPQMLGTSNTTGCTITGIPAQLRPTADVRFSGTLATVNNGALGTGEYGGYLQSGGTIILFNAGSSTGFTNSGSKGVTGIGGNNHPTAISYMIS